MKFSEKLMSLRKSKGWSQDEFADKIGVTRQTVSKWELDKTVPDMNKLIEMSKVFEVSLDELADNVEIAKSRKITDERSLEKRNTMISVKLFVVSLIVALILCGVGYYRQNRAASINEERRQQAYEQSQANLEQAKTRYDEVNQEIEKVSAQIDDLDLEINSLENEKIKIFQKAGLNDKYYAKDEEIKTKRQEESKLQSNLMNLKQEKFKLENGDYSEYYSVIEAKEYMIFYYIAAGIFGLLSLIALIFFLATRRK